MLIPTEIMHEYLDYVEQHGGPLTSATVMDASWDNYEIVLDTAEKEILAGVLRQDLVRRGLFLSFSQVPENDVETYAVWVSPYKEVLNYNVYNSSNDLFEVFLKTWVDAHRDGLFND